MDPTLLYLAHSRHPRRDAEYLSTRKRDRGLPHKAMKPATGSPALGTEPLSPAPAWSGLRALLHLHPRHAVR
ncbi:hypothetical protein [Ornithinicoccus halotolerans]|uniref:hypothetical protein n=1 Tax=Ornithinicoccus halotolerans TaxID=1748220 RepID=UPI001297E8DB|nr:hypothetical protein [Ornithinicoccus halotolerans]